MARKARELTAPALERAAHGQYDSGRIVGRSTQYRRPGNTSTMPPIHVTADISCRLGYSSLCRGVRFRRAWWNARTVPTGLVRADAAWRNGVTPPRSERRAVHDLVSDANSVAINPLAVASSLLSLVVVWRLTLAGLATAIFVSTTR
jgi:hypothetical protein